MNSGDQTPFPSAKEERIKREASEWIAKRDRGFTAKEQDAFFDWLAQDPAHAEIYASREAIFRQMDIMVEWRPMHSIEPNPDLLVASRRWSLRHWTTLAAGIAAAFAVGFLLWLFFGPRPENEPVLLASGSAATSYERHVLKDGSVVELNRGAQVSVLLKKHKRLINLISGEAHFSVAKDHSRPFIVTAGRTQVRAVGTEFNVAWNHAEDQVEVFVNEGRILISPPARPRPSEAAETPAPAPQELSAGQGAVLHIQRESVSVEVAAYSPEMLEQRLAWKHGMLDFQDAPLSEIVSEFNRRNATQIAVGDDALNDLRISAALRPTNLESFLELLTLTENIEVDRSNPDRVILRMRR